MQEEGGRVSVLEGEAAGVAGGDPLETGDMTRAMIKAMAAMAAMVDMTKAGMIRGVPMVPTAEGCRLLLLSPPQA